MIHACWPLCGLPWMIMMTLRKMFEDDEPCILAIVWPALVTIKWNITWWHVGHCVACLGWFSWTSWMLITNWMLSNHVGQWCWPSPHVAWVLTWQMLLVHTLMAMYLVLQNLVACIQTKTCKMGSLSLSLFQFYVIDMFDSYLCFSCLFCAWLAGSIDEGIDGGSLPVCRHRSNIIQVMQHCTHYMTHQLEPVSCMWLGACVVRAAFVKFRVWPTHLLVLSGQEIQMLLWCLRILCLLHQVLNFCCNHVSACVLGQRCSMQTCSG